ncbi:ArsR family transcriptional regulator [Actinoplanes sp. NPDC023714]|uniref:arsenate reductase/protein-tyrosine-phosphatase family protein n=1 Tax=Actinoplanes sp. NPDC023714 TaxID=3154322 RepID=UPI003411AC4E
MNSPAFLTAAAHPLRWQMLTELSRSDLAVHELTGRVAQSQNLVSYHLGKLRKAGLVTARRSSADGRDTYYALDLARCSELITGMGGALHPALRLTTPPVRRAARTRVLFVCTGNSARSPMAEALLRHRAAPDGAGSPVEVLSAGVRPKPVNPHAVAVMAARGIDISHARPRHLDDVAGRPFDHVITLCDRAKENCTAGTAHWSMPEPRELSEFHDTAGLLDRRIAFLMHTLGEEGS